MKLHDNIINKISALGLSATYNNSSITISINNENRILKIDSEWETAFETYTKARSKSFNETTQSLILNNSVERPLLKMSLNIYRDPSYEFSDSNKNKVIISRASILHSLAHFDSTLYNEYFNTVIKYRLERFKSNRPISMLFRSPYTAIFIAKGRKTPPNIETMAEKNITSCLLSLSVDTGECYEIYKPSERANIRDLNEYETINYSIPNVTYDENIVSYYKVARSSPFPSQSFLAYYHVLEYFFLKVSEDSLHHQLKTYLNQPNFKSTLDNLDKIISIVRKQSLKDDETEMLRKVLAKFVDEDEFILFIKEIETKIGINLYTKKRKVFGEDIEISLKAGHALSNASKIIKHIRNSIVHSSDKYSREDCHIPNTKNENIIEEFIPLIKFFSEKIIYGTAT